jgi:hypothetical protein
MVKKGHQKKKEKKISSTEDSNLGIKLNKIIYTNSTSIIKLIQLPNSDLAALQADGCIMIISTTKTWVENVMFHPNPENFHSFFSFSEDKLITASEKNLNLWNFQENKILDILNIESLFVMKNDLNDDIYILNSNNFTSTISHYKIGNGKFIFQNSFEMKENIHRKSKFLKVSSHKIAFNLRESHFVIDVESKTITEEHQSGFGIFSNFWTNQFKESFCFSSYGEVYQHNDEDGSWKYLFSCSDQLNCSSKIGKYIVTGGGGTIKFWAMKDFSICPHKTIKVHDYPLTSIISISNRKFITSSFDGSIKLWTFIDQNTIIFEHFTEYELILKRITDISFHFQET